MDNIRSKKMISQAKKIIKNLKSTTVNGIISELINNYHYYNEPSFFYNFYGLQGGTIHQLAGYILLNRAEAEKPKPRA
jgi:hypothetical protein